MADGGEVSQELKVEGRVVGLSFLVLDSFLEKKARGDQNCCTRCWSTPPACVSEASTAKEIGAPGMGCTRMGTEERMSRAGLKAASRVGVQSNSIPGPLRLLVRGPKINAAFLINFL